MNRRSIILSVLLAAFAGLASIGPLPAAFAQSLDELRERFQQRYPEIARAKREGTLGETWEGQIAIVTGANKKLQQLVTEENRDRRTLYQIIAEREKTTPDLVARRNAQRNFQKAEPDEFLRGRDGTWYRKRNAPPENEDPS